METLIRRLLVLLCCDQLITFFFLKYVQSFANFTSVLPGPRFSAVPSVSGISVCHLLVSFWSMIRDLERRRMISKRSRCGHSWSELISLVSFSSMCCPFIILCKPVSFNIPAGLRAHTSCLISARRPPIKQLSRKFSCKNG